MDYYIDRMKFRISYQELKEQYTTFCLMPDEEFLKRLPEAAHLACIICWFKEIKTQDCLGDTGIVHELIHLIHIPDEPVLSLSEIRKEFERVLELV